MILPFTSADFYSNFAAYNRAVWPAPAIAGGLAAVAILAVFRRPAIAGRVSGLVLALMWAFTGVAYDILFFTRINPAAYVFGALFLIEAGLIAHYGLRRKAFIYGRKQGRDILVGLALIAYAVVLYPMIGTLAGHNYPAAPMFGIAPCSVTIFTFGMLLMTRERLPRLVLAIPLLWAVIGGAAAFLLLAYQDWGLPVAGALSVYLLEKRAKPLP
jgi:hypothetical protein